MAVQKIQGITVLHIDDDISLLESLKIGLEKEGIEVYSASSAQEGLKMLYNVRPSVVILDVMMPDMDGWETCRRIRQLTNVPILFLTAKAEEADILQSYFEGGDDFLQKPFSLKILKAKLDALVRRKMGIDREKGSDLLSLGSVQMDFGERTILKNGEEVSLTPTEFNLLAYLAQNRGRVLTHRELLTHVWGWEYADETQYLKLYISYLRKKLEDDPRSPKIILTERGVGYRFARQVRG